MSKLEVVPRSRVVAPFVFGLMFVGTAFVDGSFLVESAKVYGFVSGFLAGSCFSDAWYAMRRRQLSLPI